MYSVVGFLGATISKITICDLKDRANSLIYGLK